MRGAFGIEPVAIIFEHYLREAAHSAQRGSQVVRDRVAERLDSRFASFSAVSVACRSVVSRMALVTKSPSSVCNGLKLISTGNSV